MHKVKNKNKAAKIPKPISIKKEKTEEDRTLKSMAHYIDDRLELVKQIFGSLKPKTITNLAPEFLKKKSLIEIEEQCLNELLCISTKRLLSIINADKCPSDTESSEDSDVQHKEEHISLEEISSDSEIERASGTARKKSNANGSKKNVKKSAEPNANDGQISVLELLELQARARAIRSQLALEPVTKIEVDSDETTTENKSTSKTIKKSNGDRNQKANVKEKSSNSRASSTSTTSTQNKPNVASVANESKGREETTKRTTKKIKIKRNFRKSQQEKEDIQNQVMSANSENPKRGIKNEKRSRSTSLDVIPIVAEPETLMISDSSDTETESSEIAAKKKKEVVEILEVNIIAQKEQVAISEEENKNVQKPTETEEGEITETDTEKEIAEVTEYAAEAEAIDLNNINKEDAITSDDIETTKNVTENVAGDESVPSQTGTAQKSVENEILDKRALPPSENVEKCLEKEEESDDQNDDVISIEGGDLETEMTEHLEEDNTKMKSSYRSPTNDLQQQQKDDDIISLESSDAETEKNSSESWHSRYLKSSKVSKVLAESRLANRVRDNIKKSKRNKSNPNASHTDKSSKGFTSKHEDGSIDQYKELLQMRQRKN